MDNRKKPHGTVETDIFTAITRATATQTYCNDYVNGYGFTEDQPTDQIKLLSLDQGALFGEALIVNNDHEIIELPPVEHGTGLCLPFSDFIEQSNRLP